MKKLSIKIHVITSYGYTDILKYPFETYIIPKRFLSFPGDIIHSLYLIFFLVHVKLTQAIKSYLKEAK